VILGGSTIVLLFERDKVVWDEDLINGRASLGTLVRVRPVQLSLNWLDVPYDQETLKDYSLECPSMGSYLVRR
jgi:hypothetical protein